MTAIADDIVAITPKLRRFALKLSRNEALADDLVQDGIVQALTHINQFIPGTNLDAWLITIIRNKFLSIVRKTKREVEDADGSIAGMRASPENQSIAYDAKEAISFLAMLPPDQADVLIRYAISGDSYEQIARDLGVSEGTIKSRMWRARQRMTELMSQ